MTMFKSYIGIDYSGAKTPLNRLPGLSVFKAQLNDSPIRVESPNTRYRNWCRKEVAYWCLEQIETEKPCIIGIDHAFSFPMEYMQKFQLTNWDQFLEDFQKYWKTDKDTIKVDDVRANNPRRYSDNLLRLTEKWTPAAQSVFKLDGQGSVGKSTHTGIPWLRLLRRKTSNRARPHFWPFDGFDIPEGRTVVAEVYPSLFKRRYSRLHKSADDHDAYCVARWLQDMDGRGSLNKYFNPPLTYNEKVTAQLEGWILGVS